MHLSNTEKPNIKSHKTDSEMANSTLAVFGGGLTGLSAGYHLMREGLNPVVYEADSVVGGLSRTIETDGFRYDIGGHRFFTYDDDIRQLVLDLLGDEMLTVARTSKIFMRDRFFDYPLKPINAIFGLGPLTVLSIGVDYALERLARLSGIGRGKCISLEDWVVMNFGRTMFDIYFKPYSEKVWGMDCKHISASWVEKRIQGLSLFSALKNALFKFTGREIPSLVDEFDYPSLGIGRLSERLEDEINTAGAVTNNARLIGFDHDGVNITSARVQINGTEQTVQATHYLSTVPLPALVKGLEPPAPTDVLDAAESLGFRDLLTVSIAIDRENVTGESWVYIPEQKYAFGRLHEPRNWSSAMAPDGKTLVVVEYFCFKGDSVWNTPDSALHDMTVAGLVELGFIKDTEVLFSEVLRVPGAYPLFKVGYEDNVSKVMDYLEGFDNLSVAGRAGSFAYLNMDHAMNAGIKSAQEAMSKVRS